MGNTTPNTAITGSSICSDYDHYHSLLTPMWDQGLAYCCQARATTIQRATLTTSQQFLLVADNLRKTSPEVLKNKIQAPILNANALALAINSPTQLQKRQFVGAQKSIKKRILYNLLIYWSGQHLIIHILDFVFIYLQAEERTAHSLTSVELKLPE